MTKISVIVPTLNESGSLETTLQPLRAAGVEELIVVDGGSEDGTVELARAANARVFSCKKGRARQLNLGAREASGDVLLFVHADTVVLASSIGSLREAMGESLEIVGGAFVRTFDSSSLWLKLTCFLASWRGRFFGLFLGDQAIFVRRETWESLDGFREDMSAGEDLDFSARMRRRGRTRILGPAVISSARRFDKLGPQRQTWKDLAAAIRILRDSGERKS